jgi:serine/threonine protein phosphatase PrpC
MMILFAGAAQAKNAEIDKPLEDVYLSRSDLGVFCLADGITRSRDPWGRYPQPSPAKIAAELAVTSIMNAVCRSPRNESDIENVLQYAFEQANGAIAACAGDGGASRDCECYDLPGTTATCVVLGETWLAYGHVGDGALVQISKQGRIAQLTSNQTAAAEAWFSERPFLNRSTRTRISRGMFRNNPRSQYGYGALTGERIALDMVEYGFSRMSIGDRLLLFSDGLKLWFDRLLVDRAFAAMSGHWLDAGDLASILDSAAEEERRQGVRSDDKTLIAVTIDGTE